MGFDSVPKPGSILLSSDLSRKRATEKVTEAPKPEVAKTDEEVVPANLDELFAVYDQQASTRLNLVVKAESEGSLDAVKFAISKIKIKDIAANIVFSGVGVVNDNDVLLAQASSAMLVGFNVQADPNTKKLAKQNSINIKIYNIIFDLTDAVTEAIKMLVKPEYRDVLIGKAEVRKVFNISDVGNIAGCFVIEGIARDNAKVRIVRNRYPVHETKIKTLKRFKDDVREVKTGYECGIGLIGYDDLHESDILEFYEVKEVI